jgi:hypothetical protein
VAGTPGPQSGASAFAKDLGSGELVGKIVNTSSRVTKRRVQVLAAGREWTLHVPDNTAITGGRGMKVSVHDLDVGTYVRAIGRRIGNTRLRADRVFVIGDRMALRRSGLAGRSSDHGYFVRTAGYRTR